MPRRIAGLNETEQRIVNQWTANFQASLDQEEIFQDTEVTTWPRPRTALECLRGRIALSETATDFQEMLEREDQHFGQGRTKIEGEVVGERKE